MGNSYSKSKGRGTKSPPFAMLPHHITDSPNYRKMTDKAKVLLVDILRFYNRKNNGDLAITFSMMKSRGWASDETLTDAREELTHYGFLTKSRQGGRNQCSLFALTFFPINECNGKHDLKPTTLPSDDWKIERMDKPLTARQKRKLKKSLPRQSGKGTPTIGVVDSRKVTYLPRQSG